jgi:hypothetical protein
MTVTREAAPNCIVLVSECRIVVAMQLEPWMRRLAGFNLVALNGLLLAVTLFFAPESALAKGGYARPPDSRFDTAGSAPTQAPGTILGGCGPKRVRDAVTQKCRGPADIGN